MREHRAIRQKRGTTRIDRYRSVEVWRPVGKFVTMASTNRSRSVIVDAQLAARLPGRSYGSTAQTEICLRTTIQRRVRVNFYHGRELPAAYRRANGGTVAPRVLGANPFPDRQTPVDPRHRQKVCHRKIKQRERRFEQAQTDAVRRMTWCSIASISTVPTARRSPSLRS